MEAYKDATSQPYGYLVLDFSPGAVEAYRVRTRVFAGEDMKNEEISVAALRQISAFVVWNARE